MMIWILFIALVTPSDRLLQIASIQSLSPSFREAGGQAEATLWNWSLVGCHSPG